MSSCPKKRNLFCTGLTSLLIGTKTPNVILLIFAAISGILNYMFLTDPYYNLISYDLKIENNESKPNYTVKCVLTNLYKDSIKGLDIDLIIKNEKGVKFITGSAHFNWLDCTRVKTREKPYISGVKCANYRIGKLMSTECIQLIAKTNNKPNIHIVPRKSEPSFKLTESGLETLLLEYRFEVLIFFLLFFLLSLVGAILLIGIARE